TRDASYTLQISDALRAEDGAPLAEPYKLDLSTVGYLTVSDVLPRNGSNDIAADSAITVIFNRPVVELVIAEEMANLPSPITITPAAEGKGEWLNTSIYMFKPEPALAGGTTYTVTVNSDLTSLDGAVLEAPYTWYFTTSPPEVIEVFPQDLSSDEILDPLLQVKFNQPMDQASVEANFFLRPQGQSEGTLPGTFEWAEDGAGFSFEPADRLQLDTIYDFGMNAEAVKTVNGGAALRGSARWTFATVPLPAIVSTTPSDGATDVVLYGMDIHFASPMDIKTLADKITIEPEPAREPDGYYNDYNNSYTLNFPVDPSTQYTVTIAPGMADVYGNTIQEGRTITFTTAPAPPDVIMNVPGSVGFYNAQAEHTQLFINQINNTRLDLQLYNVPLDEFGRKIASSSYDLAYDLQTDALSLLRSWTEPIETPLNNWRYQLLQISSSFECTGAPAS
ncbi:MAG: Ig-like domain-containing protein, partial [Anaerolineae bacterium]|nr:Ig-like domain-containing protein [Anaerolineae bacterium]